MFINQIWLLVSDSFIVLFPPFYRLKGLEKLFPIINQETFLCFLGFFLAYVKKLHASWVCFFKSFHVTKQYDLPKFYFNQAEVGTLGNTLIYIHVSRCMPDY